MDVGAGAAGAATVELRVGEADTAVALGSGDVPVLGTPRVLALMEAATVAAAAGALPAGATSVGTRVELEHLAATPIGATVVAEALLSTVDGRRLEFAVTVREGDTVVARGRVERMAVDRARFLAKVAAR
jgi:fluoroacetyl-CoA thioesterase